VRDISVPPSGFGKLFYLARTLRADKIVCPTKEGIGQSCRVRIADRDPFSARNGPKCGPYENKQKRLSIESACADAPVPATQPTTTPALPSKVFKTRDGKTLPSMETLAGQTGDVKAGAIVFRNDKSPNCIKCHQIGEEGNMIGPPLTVIGGKLSKAQLYESILYPSAAIEMGYETWVVKTKDGEVFSGIKAEDTADHITIKDTDGKYHDVDRDKIGKLVKQNVSLMPEGLNEGMTQQELVNLVEYLESLKP
jgi:putative heme-binding domain-containing protein